MDPTVGAFTNPKQIQIAGMWSTSCFGLMSELSASSYLGRCPPVVELATLGVPSN